LTTCMKCGAETAPYFLEYKDINNVHHRTLWFCTDCYLKFLDNLMDFMGGTE
jgi:hypothetical protein